MVSNALVSSRLDYCKSLFCSLSSKNITRLQNIHNCLARFVSGASRFSHVTPILSLSTGFLLNNESFSKPGYSYISTLPLASQNPLPHICLYTSAVKTKSPSIFPQFINLKFISTSPSHMMHQNSGMICH